MRRDENFHKNNIKDAINKMQKVYNCNYEKVFTILSKYQMMQDFFNSQLVTINMENLQIEKDKEFLKFINFCFYYLDLQNQNNSNLMYWYSISRLNLQLQDLENVQMGYSKVYLELLGLDIDSLQQIFQEVNRQTYQARKRKQQINLYKRQKQLSNLFMKRYINPVQRRLMVLQLRLSKKKGIQTICLSQIILQIIQLVSTFQHLQKQMQIFSNCNNSLRKGRGFLKIAKNNSKAQMI
ncbi:hypothetical protein ABPG72_018674 [Tetrahymena utriculariae]